MALHVKEKIRLWNAKKKGGEMCPAWYLSASQLLLQVFSLGTWRIKWYEITYACWWGKWFACLLFGFERKRKINSFNKQSKPAHWTIWNAFSFSLHRCTQACMYFMLLVVVGQCLWKYQNISGEYLKICIRKSMKYLGINS